MKHDTICSICKNKFNSTRNNAKYCSAECKVEGAKQKRKTWEENRPNYNKERMKAYRDKNPDEAKLKARKYREDNREILKEKRKLYDDANKEKKKEYYEKNKEIIKNRSIEHYKNNREKYRAREKEYRQVNKEKINAYANEYVKTRYKNDPDFKVKTNCRIRISQALRSGYKSSNTIDLIGCDIQFLMGHLENQFKGGMSWENYGEWHIDHILPCASFDLTKEKNQRECFNYRNLQPLWAEENIKKSDKIL